MTLILTDNLKSRVDAELNAIVSTRDMQPFYRMMSYHMGWADQHGNTDTSMSRERTHGVLSLLSCRAVGGDIEAALPVAAAVELCITFVRYTTMYREETPSVTTRTPSGGCGVLPKPSTQATACTRWLVWP